MSISVETVDNLMKRIGLPPAAIKQHAGGSNHYVFEVNTLCGQELIVKFPRIRETERKYQTANRDTLFGGELSMEREAYLFDAIRASGIPTPQVTGVFDTPQGRCLVVQRSPGMNLVEYMAQCKHSLGEFLQVMKNLGADMRKLHNTRYPSFGNIMIDGKIEPEGVSNFADRYAPINNRLIDICRDKGGLSGTEYDQVISFFAQRFEELRPVLDIAVSPATLVITDLHGGNFFLKDQQCSGYFDVESAQAAPAAFELYAMRFFVFNFYGAKEYKLAENAFWHAYYEGQRSEPPAQFSQLMDFFSICRLMELFQSYWGYVDGLRDRWGEIIKDILFDCMQGKPMDYQRLGEIWRQRDGQPEQAN